MELVVVKVICLVVFLLIPVFFGFLPLVLVCRGHLKLNDSKRGKTILAFANCFAGGVFLGTSLLSLQAEGMEEFEEYKETVGFVSHYPFFQIGIGVGFFLVALIEKLAFKTQQKSHDRHHHSGEGRGSHEGELKPSGQGGGGGGESGGADTCMELQTRSAHLNTGREGMIGMVEVAGCEGDDRVGGVIHGARTEVKRDHAKVNNPQKKEQKKIHPHHSKKTNGTDDNKNINETPQTDQSRAQGVKAPDIEAQVVKASDVKATEDDASGHQEHEQDNMSGIRVTLLLLAMSFHTIFDGLAVGLQKQASTLWSILTALLIHKTIVSACLGMEMAAVMSHRPLRAFLSLLLFAVMAPVGVAIGIGVTSGGVDVRAQLLAGSVLQAVATGAFLYVTCVEILGQAMASHDGSVLKVLVAFLGFAAMSGVKVWDEE